MKRYVPPHDLRALCDACDVSLEFLVFFSGIEEETLLAFARGEVPLSAHDRITIMSLLYSVACGAWRNERYRRPNDAETFWNAMETLSSEAFEEEFAELKKALGVAESDSS
jgi:hypothetical protein